MNKKNNKKKEWITPVVLSWVGLSFGGIIHFLTINTNYSIILFGQFVLILGIIMFFSEKKGKKELTYNQKREYMITKLMSIIPFLVGLTCIFIPILSLYQEWLKITIIWESVIPLLFSIVIIIVGLSLILIPYINNKKLKKDCTYHVTAKIIEYETIRDERSVSYCPIYEFYYKNKAYKVTKNQFSNVGKFKKIGSNVELIINPNEPEQFIDNSIFSKAILIFGIMCIVEGIPLLYFLLSTRQFIK